MKGEGAACRAQLTLLYSARTEFGPQRAILSPLGFGFVIDRTGNWELPFLGSIGLLLFGAILAFWMKPEEGLAGAGLGDTAAVEQASV